MIAHIQKFKVDVGIRLTPQYKEGRAEKTMVKFHLGITRLISVCLRHSDCGHSHSDSLLWVF